MAERFGHDPDVIGWQIDNEYANESYGSATRKQFQDWLRGKYKTLDNLNARWTTAYWSQTYQSWDQIPIEETYGNPGLLLNWKELSPIPGAAIKRTSSTSFGIMPILASSLRPT